jgi:tellurite resistance protein TehA-like permease
VRDLVAGTSVVLWAFASWLIPALVMAGWWRHVINRVPLQYGPEMWGIIFPLGMYSVAGTYLGIADRLPLVGAIGRAELWVAVLAWTVTFIAMLVHLVRNVLRVRSLRQ